MLTCRTAFMIACATNALLIGLGPTSIALADEPTKSLPMLVDPYWYTEGEVQVGGRFFLNHPQHGAMANMGHSLAKYYEYSDERPGPFSNIWIAAGTRDGVRRVEMYGRNIGYRDQRFGLDYSQVGKYYFNFEWDQRPHVYSTSAQAIYNGTGGNYLFLMPGLSNLLFTLTGGGNPLTLAQAGAVWTALNAASHNEHIDVQRNIASGDVRWTPNDAWDVRTHFTNIHREGSTPSNIQFTGNGANGVNAQIAKPVNDSTQNFGVNAEYAGTSFWDKNYTFKLAYNGSVYTDNNKAFIVENPFCATGAGVCARSSGPLGMMSLWPNNTSNGVSGTLALDLPWKARYVSTASWTRMEQNDPFLPFTINPNMLNAPGGTGMPVLPASRLGGAIDTLMFNNVLTKEITTDLRAKASYRVYDFNNRTPELLFNNWVITDINNARGQSASYAPVRSLSMSYTKQNGGLELDWRVLKSLRAGASYGYERYDWKREAATSTDEHSFKGWADWKPATWFKMRASALFARRFANNYNYYLNQAGYMWGSVPGNTWSSPDYRIFYLSGRERSKFDVSADLTLLPGVTISPTFAYIHDNHPMPHAAWAITAAALNNPVLLQEGLRYAKKTQAGLDATWSVTSNTKLFAYYMYERSDRGYQGGSPGTNTLTSLNAVYSMNAPERVHTVRGGFDTEFIPRLNIKGTYTFAKAMSSQAVPFWSGVTTATFVNFPAVHTLYHQADMGMKYTFADDWVRSLGLNGKMSAGLNYTWQRNVVDNWQAQQLNYPWQIALANAGYFAWMGWYNPNYNIHRLSASLAYKW